MTNLDFMKEEYLTLRREIEASIQELATLERQCVLATAAIYTWLSTHSLKEEAVLQLAWSIPVIISIFGALRSFAADQQLKRLGRYIQEIENEVAQNNKHAKGWEHFHEQATLLWQIRTWIRTTFCARSLLHLTDELLWFSKKNHSGEAPHRQLMKYSASLDECTHKYVIP